MPAYVITSATFPPNATNPAVAVTINGTVDGTAVKIALSLATLQTAYAADGNSAGANVEALLAPLMLAAVPLNSPIPAALANLSWSQ